MQNKFENRRLNIILSEGVAFDPTGEARGRQKKLIRPG